MSCQASFAGSSKRAPNITPSSVVSSSAKRSRVDDSPALPMKKVWDDPMLTKFADDKGWECGYCGNTWNGRVAPARVVQHLMPAFTSQRGMSPCSHSMHAFVEERRILWENFAAARKTSAETRNSNKALIAMRYHNANSRMTAELSNQCGFTVNETDDIFADYHPSASTMATGSTRSDLMERTYYQPTMVESARKKKEQQDMKLQVAIAQFVHGLGLPFNTGDTDLFRNVLEISRNIRGSFVLLSCNQMSNYFLDMVCEDNMKDIKSII